MSKKKLNHHKQTFEPMLSYAQSQILENVGEGLFTTFNVDTWKDEVKEFSNLKYLINDMKRRTQYGIDWVSRYIAISLGTAIEHWYNDYEPVKYVRTETLFNSVTVWRDNYYYEGHVSLGDYPSSMQPSNSELGYSNAGSKILELAEQGLHGATGKVINPQTGKTLTIGCQVGGTQIGIWGELIGFLETGYWGSTSGGTGVSQSTLLDSSALDAAFVAGVRSGGKASYGRDTPHIKGRRK